MLILSEGIGGAVLARVASIGIQHFVADEPVVRAIHATDAQMFEEYGYEGVRTDLQRWCNSAAFFRLLKRFSAGKSVPVDESVVKDFLEASKTGHDQAAVGRVIHAFFQNLQVGFVTTEGTYPVKRMEGLHAESKDRDELVLLQLNKITSLLAVR